MPAREQAHRWVPVRCVDVAVAAGVVDRQKPAADERRDSDAPLKVCTEMPFALAKRTVELRNRESIAVSLLVFLIDPAIRFALARVCTSRTRK